MFLLKCHHSLPSPVVKHSHLLRYPSQPTWLQYVGAEWSTTHRVSASSFSFCVFVRMNDFFMSDIYSLLPAIASSLSQPTRRASMHSNTLVLYLSSGLGCVFCQTRVKWLYDNVIPLQTYCEIVLVFSACSEWTLIKMMIQNIVVWIIVFFVLAH